MLSQLQLQSKPLEVIVSSLPPTFTCLAFLHFRDEVIPRILGRTGQDCTNRNRWLKLCLKECKTLKERWLP